MKTAFSTEMCVIADLTHIRLSNMTQLHAHFEYIPALSKITAICTLELKLRQFNMIYLQWPQ